MDDDKLKSLMGRVIDERLSAFFGFGGARLDGCDLTRILRFSASIDSANYVQEHLAAAPTFNNAIHLLDHAVNNIGFKGLLIEFGVASGRTINHVASKISETIYGFDSFEGLPEDWRPDIKKGAFAQAIPDVKENVELVVGFFDASLPKFLERHPGDISFLHVDCDLYSSTKTIFNLCRDRLAPGTVIVFDEYFNYVGWRQHEYKAFKEFMSSLNSSDKFSGYEYIGYVPSHQQVAVKLY